MPRATADRLSPSERLINIGKLSERMKECVILNETIQSDKIDFELSKVENPDYLDFRKIKDCLDKQYASYNKHPSGVTTRAKTVQECLNKLKGEVNELSNKVNILYKFHMSKFDPLDSINIWDAVSKDEPLAIKYWVNLNPELREAGEPFGDRKMAPIHVAAFNGCYNSMKTLIDLKANVDLPLNLNKMTALHIACVSGAYHIVELLINNYANINAIDAHEDTPMHKAVRSNNIKIVLLLIKRGANLLLENSDEYNPMEMAATMKYDHIYELLAKYT